MPTPRVVVDAATVADRLRSARTERGWTQRTLAFLADMGEARVCEFEAGAKRPGLDNLVRLAVALDVTVDWLIGRTPASLSVPGTGSPAMVSEAEPARSRAAQSLDRATQREAAPESHSGAASTTSRGVSTAAARAS